MLLTNNHKLLNSLMVSCIPHLQLDRIIHKIGSVCNWRNGFSIQHRVSSSQLYTQ